MILYKEKNTNGNTRFVALQESYWEPVYPRYEGSFGTIVTNDSDWIKNESKYHDDDKKSWLIKLMKTYGVKQSGIDYGAMHRDMRELVEKAREKGHVLIPISTYEHSGTSVYAGLPYDHFDGKWDCSFHGFILANKTQIKKEFKVKELTNIDLELAEEHLKQEISDLDEYVSGEWYDVTSYDKDGKLIDEYTSHYNGISNVLGEQVGNFNDSDEIKEHILKSQV